MISGKHILLGVTGGIAAYKTVYLLRELQQRKAEVRVAMTPSATRFIGRETFAALSRNQVPIHIFDDSANPGEEWTRHIKWGEWADLYVIAPATANTIAKLAQGFSDNMVSALALTARCPMLVCPTMDGGMYRNPATQHNLDILKDRGVHLLDPDTGYLASGQQAQGRLPEAEVILNRIEELVSSGSVLKGKKVVVTAGPTREYLDPVRYISNPSSGKMGFALAEAARQLGAEVHLIHGPVSLPTPEGVTSEAIESAGELYEAIKKHQDYDAVIMAAAVSDFAPEKKESNKVKKENAEKSLKLKRNPDILKWLGEHKKEGQVLVGFAMETEDLLANATKKLEQKNLDWIAANDLSSNDAGFSVETNRIELLSKTHSAPITLEGTKKQVALQMLKHLFGDQL